MSPSKKHTPTFKQNALDLSDRIGVKRATEELGMSLNTLKQWRRVRKKKAQAQKGTPIPQEVYEGVHSCDFEDDPEVQAAFDPLTPKQSLFVRCYCAGPTRFNGTRSAEAAGYAGVGSTLSSVATKLLRKADIKEAMRVVFQKQRITEEELFARLEDHANVSLDDFIEIKPDGTWEWDLKKAAERGKLHLIQEISYDPNDKPGGEPKMRIKLMSRRDAHRDLAQARKVLTEVHQHSHDVRFSSEELTRLHEEARQELAEYEAEREEEDG